MDNFIVLLKNISHSQLSKPSTNTRNIEISGSQLSKKINVKAISHTIGVMRPDVNLDQNSQMIYRQSSDNFRT